MGKFTPPPVTLLDVLEALPEAAMPLSYRLMVVRTKGAKASAYVAVELVYTGMYGDQHVYKRWGRDVRSSDTLAVMRTLLLAAQECYLWAEGKDVGELTRFIEWQLGVPTHLG